MSDFDINKQISVTVEGGDDAVWPYRIHGNVTHINGWTDGFPLTEDEARHLRDKLNKVLPEDETPEPEGSYAEVVYGDAIEVSELILEALLDHSSTSTSEAAVKAYLVERGVLLT